MPAITIELSEDQYARYIAAMEKRCEPEEALDLLVPLRTLIAQIVFDAEVAHGDTPRTKWVFFEAPPASAEEAAQRVFRNVQVAVQRRLDEFFRTRDYDGVLSACTYATSTVAKFQLEGQYAVTARDAHWARCYEILGAVQAGQRPLPAGVDEVMAEMPPLEWPT